MIDSTLRNNPIIFRIPGSDDGVAVHKLIADCPPLDSNSMYCNLLQCTHFSATSVAAYENDDVIGFISGYLHPNTAETLFIWQVAVAEKARGKGLARRMLQELLLRESTHKVRYIETTITLSNHASWALFESFAKQENAPLTQSVMFDRKHHFAGQHDTEMLVRIGPISR